MDRCGAKLEATAKEDPQGRGYRPRLASKLYPAMMILAEVAIGEEFAG